MQLLRTERTVAVIFTSVTFVAGTAYRHGTQTTDRSHLLSPDFLGDVLGGASRGSLMWCCVVLRCQCQTQDAGVVAATV